MGIKSRYARKKIKKIAGLNRHYPVVPDLDSIKTAGVIWQPSQKEAYSYLKKHFNRRQVIFRGFCVFEEDNNPPADFNTITSQDLNWLGFPRKEIIDDFINFRFDILLNTALKQNFVLDYITLLSKSKFKVGTSQDENNYFDLNIKIGEKDDPLFLVKQQIFYLSQLNKKSDL